MSEPRRLCLDWRGKPDLSKWGDFYSIGPFPTSRPVTGNPKGRVLVAVSPTILFEPSGNAAGEPGSFNQRLFAAVMKHGALRDRTGWENEAGWYARILDLTARGMVQDFLALIAEMFPWPAGIHGDYFTPLGPDIEAWNRALAGFANGVRQQGKLFLAQQYKPTPPSSAASGEFWEQSPTSFGQTMESHAKDMKEFRKLVKRVDNRETLFVSEIQQPLRYPQWYLDQVKAWALANDVVMAYGRDASALGAPRVGAV